MSPGYWPFAWATLALAALAIVVVVRWGNVCGYSGGENTGSAQPGHACGMFHSGVAPVLVFLAPLGALALGRNHRNTFALAAICSAIALAATWAWLK